MYAVQQTSCRIPCPKDHESYPVLGAKLERRKVSALDVHQNQS